MASSSSSVSFVPLSFPLILFLSFIQVAFWLYGWFVSPSRWMRAKQAQTVHQLIVYTTLTAIGIIVHVYDAVVNTRINEVLGITTDEENRITDFDYNNIDVSLLYKEIPPFTGLAKLYFELEASWYLAALIQTLINRDSKDFYAMLFHHILTPLLILFSFDIGHVRCVGISVMLLHDASDVFLHAAKLLHQMGLKTIPDVTFVIFALVFLITRLIIFPTIPIAYFFQDNRSSSVARSLVYGLLFLVVLHSYWFLLILQVIRKAMKEGKVDGDIRDTPEGPDDQTKGKKQI